MSAGYGKPGEDGIAKADASRPSAMSSSGKQTEGAGTPTKQHPQPFTKAALPTPSPATPTGVAAMPDGLGTKALSNVPMDASDMREAETGMDEDTRDLDGHSYHADDADTDTSDTEPALAVPSDDYSDVMLQDRREPAAKLKEMLEAML